MLIWIIILEIVIDISIVDTHLVFYAFDIKCPNLDKRCNDLLSLLFNLSRICRFPRFDRQRKIIICDEIAK